MNVGESKITQSSKVSNLGIIFNKTLMIILLLYVEAHIFILKNMEKIDEFGMYVCMELTAEDHEKHG